MMRLFLILATISCLLSQAAVADRSQSEYFYCSALSGSLAIQRAEEAAGQWAEFYRKKCDQEGGTFSFGVGNPFCEPGHMGVYDCQILATVNCIVAEIKAKDIVQVGSLGFSCHAFCGSGHDGSEELLFLEKHRPDVLLYFGANPIWEKLVAEAKSRDIPVVFWLHDLSCADRSALRLADYVVVPSEFARRYFWETLGLAYFTLPNSEDAGPACRQFFSNIFPQPGLQYIPSPIHGRPDRTEA